MQNFHSMKEYVELIAGLMRGTFILFFLNLKIDEMFDLT